MLQLNVQFSKNDFETIAEAIMPRMKEVAAQVFAEKESTQAA